jgi:hypothetical protein
LSAPFLLCSNCAKVELQRCKGVSLQMLRSGIVFVALIVVLATIYQADEQANPCTSELFLNPASDPAAAYQCALQLQAAALDAGYEPDQTAREQAIELVLRVADLPQIIAATSVGPDTEAALAAVLERGGDPFTGELLYNGLVNGLDGIPLGCVGCHNGQTAPLAEGTWTRIDEVRLNDPALASYTVERYLVESILHPNAYIVPGYMANLMPDNYHARLNASQLADLVAYLSSQDQLIDESAR